MTVLAYAGGSPANFLDVGGGASADQVKNAFRILLSDPAVKAVFINIFGGILRCDVLATGVVVSPLLRLRAWLKRTPPAQEFQPPPDEDAD